MSITTERHADLHTGIVSYSLPKVNLLPAEVYQQRTVHRSRYIAGGIVVCALLACVGGYVWARGDAVSAERGLTEAKVRETKLQGEVAALREVPALVSKVDAAKAAQEAALAKDTPLSAILRNLADASQKPGQSTIAFKSLSVDLATAANAADPKAKPKNGVQSIGRLTITGEAKEAPAKADEYFAVMLTELEASVLRPGGKAMLDKVTFSKLTKSDGKEGNPAVLSFDVTADLTTEALTNRYERKAK